MIPREILKKTRQIEIRTNRIVTKFAERGCVHSTSRSTSDPSANSEPATRCGWSEEPSRAPLEQFTHYATH